MAVPKKRTSKSKTRSRKAQWFRKAKQASQQAISLGKSIATGNSNSFIFNLKSYTEKKESEEANNSLE